mgnify:CR=1 FL=1
MPEFSGIELCQAVRTDPHWQNLPILFLTAHRDAATVQAILCAGADDFIPKPIVGPELLTRLLNRLERTRLLQTLSHQDAMTGLSNYPQAKQILTHALAAENLASTSGVLALMRVADFAAIAQQQGPDAQHAILQAWGQCFQAFESDANLMSYWGNGEFVVGFFETTALAAQAELEPLRTTLLRQILTRRWADFIDAISSRDRPTVRALP